MVWSKKVVSTYLLKSNWLNAASSPEFFTIVQIIVMKYYIKIFIGCFFAFTISSCIRTTDVPTELKVQVLDDQGYPVAGAHVDLFDNKTDYLNNTNIVLTTTTDQNGFIYVYNLSPISYYYFISSGCLDNTYTTNRLTSPLVPNVINVYDPIYLGVVGKIKVENNSSFYSCDVYLRRLCTLLFWLGCWGCVNNPWTTSWQSYCRSL